MEIKKIADILECRIVARPRNSIAQTTFRPAIFRNFLFILVALIN
ncbi:hypothetical protein C7S16_3491 [Burkholderia thailandensis]|uniref:Uncharacterized protein n=1 Tax=Burkholderia thailandensis TaxID=57975 RepID=A0AAW9CZQ5_BURTH|nr:hypothetical protein [Burkholderia thailandensis]